MWMLTTPETYILCKEVLSSSQRSKFETKYSLIGMHLLYHFLKFQVILWSLPVVFIYLSQAELFKAFKELFTAATSRPPPYGICPYPSSRAIYAVDLMLKWSTGQNGESSSSTLGYIPARNIYLHSLLKSKAWGCNCWQRCGREYLCTWDFSFFTINNYAIIPKKHFSYCLIEFGV